MVDPGWTLSADEVFSLPIDELAISLLHDVLATNEWNSSDWMLTARSAYSARPDAVNVLSEAWGWLYAKSLVAPALEKQTLGAMFVTRRGRQAVKNGLASVRAAERLDVDLHPMLEHKVRRQYLMGEYELAAFAAIRQVEIRVRELARAPESLLGVKLMRRAFGEDGSLRSPDLDPGEQVARMELFAGAIGLFKNPTSHREVEYGNPTEAAEVVLFADLLMRVLDRVEQELTTTGT
jgi:uncharacterized protein (TIGR02391 family)